MRAELLKGLIEEQIAKVKACKSQEEMLALAKQEGIELTDEQLEAVSGGSACGYESTCRKCNCTDLHVNVMPHYIAYRCYSRGYEWQVAD